MADKMVRGSVFRSYYKFIKKKWGKDGLSECSASVGLDPDDVYDGNWYPIEMNDAIVQWIVKEKGTQNLEPLGVYVSKDMGLLYFVARFLNMKMFLKKFRDIYHEVFDFGDIEIDIKDNGASIRVIDNAYSEHSCDVWVGSFKGMLDVTKTKGTVEKKQCISDGKDHCLYELKW